MDNHEHMITMSKKEYDNMMREYNELMDGKVKLVRRDIFRYGNHHHTITESFIHVDEFNKISETNKKYELEQFIKNTSTREFKTLKKERS